MDIHSTRPTGMTSSTLSEEKTTAIKTDVALNEAQKTTTHSTTSEKKSTRPTSTFSARATATPLPKFPTSKPYVPEPSHLGRYISYGVIALLVVLLIFQIISKSSLRRQVSSLESQIETLNERAATLQRQLASQDGTAAVAVIPGTTEVAQPETLALITYPVMHREGDFQKIAQTIQVTSASTVGNVVLRGVAGEGDDGQVAIYKSDDFYNLDDQRPIASESFDTGAIPAGQPFTVEFSRGVDLEQGKRYILVVETTNRNASADIGYRTATPTAPGTMWVRSRRVSEAGEVLSNGFSWQEMPGYDLFFELHAAE